MSEIKYLFDTNVLSELIKNPSGRLADKISELNEKSFCTSIIVACELSYGAEKKGSASLSTKVKSLLNNINVLPLKSNLEHDYAYIRTYLEKKGQQIGAHDLLIAAQALDLNMTLVTANEREFKRVPKLKVENWLK